MPSAQKKVFAGPKIRRLRRELGLSQLRMASELDFSSSYLNLVERNQRPVSAQFLLRLAEVYDVDLRSLAGDNDARAFADMNEILSDPLFKGLNIPKSEVQESATTSPALMDAISTLYRAFNEQRKINNELSARFTERGNESTNKGSSFPVDEVRDFLHTQKNYFPELDEIAEELNQELQLSEGGSYGILVKRLQDKHNIKTRIMNADVLPETLRYFDPHRHQLLMSELMSRSARKFQVSYQLGLLEFSDIIENLLIKADLRNEAAKPLLRITLANYFAAALLMPYQDFKSDADLLNHDVDHLSQRYGVSFEQVCHRLTTLQRPGNRGIPFFFIRVDNAGNVSKRFSVGSFHFSQFGGTCPLWSVHDTFSTPGKIFTQIIQMPDETTYFSVARTVKRSGAPHNQPSQQLALALGCEISYAKKLTYSKGHDLTNLDATPIGPNCRLCERRNCAQRAHPPISREMVLDVRSRGVTPYRFAKD
jgi:hypothetical protein